jgi:hypothetical protein
VSIPIEGSVIHVSIYRSPAIWLPVTYSFPDETLREGNVFLLSPNGLPELLTGRVFFGRVQQGTAVEGKFDLATATGQRFHGTFIAEWGNQFAYCG